MPFRYYKRHHRLGLTFLGQWFIAIAVLIGLLLTLAMMKRGDILLHHRILAVLTVACSLPIYALINVYDRRISYLAVIRRLVVAWAVLLWVLLAMTFVTKTSEHFSREVILLWVTLGFLAQCLAFIPLHWFSRRYYRNHDVRQTSLIIGTGQLARKLADVLVNIQHAPMKGLVQHDDQFPAKENAPYPILGSAAHLRSLIDEYKIKKIYIALPAEDMGDIEDLYIDLLDLHVDVVWVPDVVSLLMLNHSVIEVGGIPAINLNESPLTANPSAALLKEALDRALALLAIVAISPLLVLIAVGVKLSSPGPVLFKQPRHGWNGKIFDVWKFRSMRLHDAAEVKQATRNDSRITVVGRLIRRTSLDELPQFFNVLCGDMSLVGPRPHAVAHNDYYSDKIQAYMARHRIKPGITGLAQINGARGETETLDKMERRVQLDLEYINNWSLWRDIVILFKTPLSLLSKNIY